jgi:hypothetical protein
MYRAKCASSCDTQPFFSGQTGVFRHAADGHKKRCTHRSWRMAVRLIGLHRNRLPGVRRDMIPGMRH